MSTSLNNSEEARRMLRAHRYGALSTLSNKFAGYPFGSITPYLVDHDGSLLILISVLAEHTKNIQHDPRVSIISHDQRDPHIQTQGRVSALGNAEPAADQEQAALRYLRYFPESRTYFEMPGFSFFRIRPIAVRFIGGFGHIHWVNMDNYAVAHAEAFAQQEQPMLDEMNARHQDSLLRLLHQRHGINATDVQAIGLDCDGLDVRCGDQVWRLDIAETITDPAQFFQAFIRM